MSNKYSSDKEAIDGLAKSFQELKAEIGKVIVGHGRIISSTSITSK